MFALISWLNTNNEPVEISQVLRITGFLVNRWGAVKKGNLQTIFFQRHGVDRQDTLNQCTQLQNRGYLISDENEYVTLAHSHIEVKAKKMTRVFL